MDLGNGKLLDASDCISIPLNKLLIDYFVQVCWNNIPSQVPVTNYDAMKKVLKIFVQVAKMKLLEEKWEKPAVVRVLRQLNTAKTPRVVTQWEKRAVPPRVEEEIPMRG